MSSATPKTSIYSRDSFIRTTPNRIGLVYRDSFHPMGLVWGEAFDWSVESTTVTAVSSQLVNASRDFSIVGVKGMIERLDIQVSNVPINEPRMYNVSNRSKPLLKYLPTTLDLLYFFEVIKKSWSDGANLTWVLYSTCKYMLIKAMNQADHVTRFLPYQHFQFV